MGRPRGAAVPLKGGPVTMWDLPSELRRGGMELAGWLPAAGNPNRLDTAILLRQLRDSARAEYAARRGMVLPAGWVSHAKGASAAVRKAAVRLADSLIDG